PRATGRNHQHCEYFYKINNIQIKCKKSKLLLFNGPVKSKLRQIDISGSTVQEEKPSAVTHFLGVWLNSKLKKKHVITKAKAIIFLTAAILSRASEKKLNKLQQLILKLAKTKAELATTMANSILYHPNICNFKNLASKITIKRISSLHTRLNSAEPKAETSEIRFLQGLSLGRIVNTIWDPKFNKLLQGLWKYNLTCQTIGKTLEHQISFKPKNIVWKLILQDNKTLATWSQLKLIKSAKVKEENQFGLNV
ncbi:3759_t:CDS:2, partial [Gigaspora rosea]